LREKIRIKKHRNAKPSASIIDSQTVKITAACEGSVACSNLVLKTFKICNFPYAAKDANLSKLVL
jgi:hypothetical protein